MDEVTKLSDVEAPTASETSETNGGGMKKLGSSNRSATFKYEHPPNSIFSFEDCRYVIKTKGDGEKQILKGITGEVRSGEVLAIMGPSGAGKTMLMNLLTLEPGPGVRTGKVNLNGKPMSLDIFKKYCSVVQQSDSNWAYLTPREAIDGMIDLLLEGTREEKEEFANYLLKEMGLTSCQNTKAGNQIVQGLSGGQKRRLSIAIALVRKPALLFLDEPTSGLDAAAAVSIMGFLKSLAQNLNIMIICTIHQPSSKVYNAFDKTMVLSGGEVTYFGAATNMIPYLRSIDRPVPMNSNPAEHILDLVNGEFVDPKEVEYMLESWKRNEKAHALNSSLPSSFPEIQSAKLKRSRVTTVVTLMKRMLLLIIRNPFLYIGRGVTFMICCAFFSLVYLKTRDRNQEQAVYKMFLLMWHIGVPSSLGVVAVYSYNQDYFSLRREMRSGTYSPLAYWIAHSTVEIPLIILLSICALAIGGYGISGYHAPMFVQMTGFFALALWSFESMAHFMAFQYENPLIGMLIYMQLWFGSFLFAGVMVPEKEVVWPLRCFVYVLPLRWYLSGGLYIDLHDTTFSGAIPDVTTFDGYSCPTIADAKNCYGFTGYQVLDSIGNTYKSVSSKDTVAMDALYMALIGLFFKLACLLVITKKAHAVKLIHSK